MAKRKPNPFYEVAEAIADEMCVDGRIRKQVVGQTRAHLSKLCNPDKSNGEKTWPAPIVLASWRWACNILLADGMSRISVIRLLNGSPNWIERYLIAVKDEMPPVFESQAHDDYIKEHAEALRYLKERGDYKGYGGWMEPSDQYSGGRLKFELVERLGLLP